MTLSPGTVAGGVAPTLLGVDEDNGQLFSVDDYTDPLSTFTDNGRLKYVRNGSSRNVGRRMEVFALAADGTAQPAINKDISGFDEPVLMSLYINSVDPGGSNLVSFIGEYDAGFNNSGDNMTGLSFDPVSGEICALFRDNSSSGADRVLVISVSWCYRRYDRSTTEGFTRSDGERVM